MKIVFLEPLGISEELLEKKVSDVISEEHQVIYYPDRVTDGETLIKRSEDADIVVLSNFKFGREVISKCNKLKMICVAFTGVDHVDMEFCKQQGITVCNCAGYSTVSVSDIVFAMAINLARNIVPCDKVCRVGGTKDGLVGFELEGKTFGIIGLGAIGSRVAKIANAFGCKVIAYNRSKKEIDGVKMVSMEEVLKESDILSIHVPQNSETINLIGKRELEMMKETAILINTARGPIVNQEELADCLRSGGISGAGIDVFDIEPPLPKDHILFDVPNTVLTPHIAFASHQAFEKRADIVAMNLKAFIEGSPQNLMR
ncbi:MAG: NAD(P)-dependent oxidoreductase [Anaerovoracaceae bacterium]